MLMQDVDNLQNDPIEICGTACEPIVGAFLSSCTTADLGGFVDVDSLRNKFNEGKLLYFVLLIYFACAIFFHVGSDLTCPCTPSIVLGSCSLKS